MKIKDLDRNEIYGLEEIKKDAVKFDLLKEWLKKNDKDWSENFINALKSAKYIKYNYPKNEWIYVSIASTPTKCALTLFELDITDYQVDCSELSKDQIEEMAEVVKGRGYKLWDNENALNLTDLFKYFKYYDDEGFFIVCRKVDSKTTITYDKFIELFGGKQIKQAEKELSEIIGTDVTKPVKYKTNSLNIRLSNIDFKQITDSISDLLDYKNTKYGNSALEPLNIFANKCKTGQRLDDKLARVKNSSDLKKNDVADLIGYLILTCKENNWTNFDEFKD